uniref:Uncharacterized protein n=1 Tax=Anguilla anguilla TaxID=7936 RepID=A0A0E9TE04_ANGAN
MQEEISCLPAPLSSYNNKDPALKPKSC